MLEGNDDDERHSAGARDDNPYVGSVVTLAKLATATWPKNYSSLHIRCIADDGLVLEPTYEHPDLVVDSYGQVGRVYEDPDTQGLRIVVAREWKAIYEVRQHGTHCYFWNVRTNQTQWKAPDSLMSPASSNEHQ